MRNRSMPRRFGKKKGMTLLELMVALSVLAFGLLPLMGLMMTATATNNRNRVDTGGTFVAQQFMEAFMNQPSAGTVIIKDCAGNSITVATAGPAAAGNSNGANLTSDNRYIDFTQTASTVTANYHSNYVTCGSNGRTTTYDVRWNVRTIDTNSRMVTLAARHDLSNNGSAGGLYYQPPVTLRSIVSKF